MYELNTPALQMLVCINRENINVYHIILNRWVFVI